MQRLVLATLVFFSLASTGCNTLVVSNSDGGDFLEDAGLGKSDDAGGICDPECGENADCNTEDTCVCKTGFDGDGQSCEDIDECASDNGGCDVNALCVNAPGTRACLCNANFAGDGETCTEVWSLAGTLANVDLIPANSGTLAVSAGSRVFFGPRTGNAAQAYMRSFDFNTGQFSPNLAMPPNPPGDFCACGLGESFVSNGINLFLLGNSGHRYEVQGNRWEQFSQYQDDFRRGEAGSTFDAQTQSILLFGGRDNGTNAVRFDMTGGDPPQLEPGVLPVAMSDAVAHTPSGSSLTFVAHQDSESGVVEFFSHATGQSTWNTLADLPSPAASPRTMGHAGTKLWLADRNGKIFTFDPAAGTWNSEYLQGPAGVRAVLDVVVTSGTRTMVALSQAGTDVRAYKLNNAP